MKNLRIISLVALGLAFFSGQGFADEDFLGSVRTQIQSGLTGLRTGDYAGVASGVKNFGLGTAASGLTTLTTLPGLSQVYGAGQSTGLQINNIYGGLSNSYSTGGVQGVGRYSLGLGVSGFNSAVGIGRAVVGASYSAGQWTRQQLNNIYGGLSKAYSTGGVTGAGRFAVTNLPVLKQSYGAGQWTRQQLNNIGDKRWFPVNGNLRLRAVNR